MVRVSYMCQIMNCRMNEKGCQPSNVAKSTPKRQDLQGIRGLAIISVIAFHFYPSYFPNGYLGVDQFFVLSGFLMGMLLKRSENLPTFSIISTFYIRRFKRIIPLYLLVITITLFALYSIFPDTAIETNQESASKALLFLSNRPKTMVEDYFQMLSVAVDLFTHTWSLSVEVQFYAIIPFLFIIGSRFSAKFQFVYYTVISVISFLYYCLADPSVAFNSVYCRVWQFLTGIMVFLLTDFRKNLEYNTLPQDLENVNNEEKYSLLEEKIEMEKSVNIVKITGLIVMCYLISYPISIPSIFARPFVTFTTGLIMLVSDGDLILSNRFLVYIGDISYSLYMIHWPIYAYWKLQLHNNQIYLIMLLLSSVFLAILIFETFEKWYLKQSSVSLAVIVIVCYSMSLVLINQDVLFAKEEFDLFGNITFDNAKVQNKDWNKHDARTITAPSCIYEGGRGPLGFCTHTGLNETGEYRIALFGNSWVANHAKLFYNECHTKMNSMIQESAYGCEPLYAKPTDKVCNMYLDKFERFLNEFKPDIAFILTRVINTGNSTGFDSDNDYIFDTMKARLDKYKKLIRNKIFILDALPKVNPKEITLIPQKLQLGISSEDIDREFVNLDGYEIARKRYERLFEYCGEKCERIDYKPIFYNTPTKTFRFFDKHGLSYVTSHNHLSPLGLEHIRHIYKNICKKL